MRDSDKMKAANYNFQKERANTLEKVLIAAILSSPTRTLKVTDISWHASTNYRRKTIRSEKDKSVIFHVESK